MADGNTASKGGLREIQRELARAADPARARISAWFFKTGKGQYGEGDKFIGLTVPMQRSIARRFRHLPLADIGRLLQSPVHEHRFTALEILVAQYEAADPATRRKIFDFYLKHTRWINNWDLVDTSAPYIVGGHLFTGSRRVLYRLAKAILKILLPSPSFCLRTTTTSFTKQWAGCFVRRARAPRPR
jgi:hypothetical protein